MALGIMQQKRHRATLIFSTRKYNNFYTGYCLKVRRSSDDATQDIGFVDGVIDIDSLLSFIGVYDGYVDTWYDQSGNGNNVTQSASSQPIIVKKGDVYTVNKRLFIFFSSSSVLVAINDCAIGNYISLFAVAKKTIPGSWGRVISSNNYAYFHLGVGQTSNYVFSAYGNGAWDTLDPNTTVVWLNELKVATSINDGDDNLFIDGTFHSSRETPMGNYNNKPSVGYQFGGLIGETMIFAPAIFTSRTSIESSIFSHFRFNGTSFHPNTASDFLSATGITDETIVGAIETLVQDLIDEGLWGKMVAVYPFVGGTAATHKYNLKDPRDKNDAFRLTFSGTIAHSSLGVLPDGTTGYANTHLLPMGELKHNSIHLSFYSGLYTPYLQYSEELGTYENHLAMCIRWSNSFYAQLGRETSGSVSVVNRNTKGFFVASKSVTNKVSSYIDGVKKLDEVTNADSDNDGNAIYLFAWNNRYTPERYSNKNCRFASIGLGLSESEVGALNTIVHNFQVSLGRDLHRNTLQDFLDITGITDETITTALDTLVDGLISNGLWEKFAAIYPFVGGSESTHKYNLKDPRDADNAYRLTFSGGVTHASTGILSNGTNGYANTHLAGASLPSLFPHISFYSRTTGAAAGKREMGSYTLGILFRWTGNYFYVYMGSSTYFSNSTTHGFFIASKTVTNKVSVYLNGSAILNEGTCSDGELGGDLFILAQNSGSGPANCSNKECAFASIGEGLTSSEVSTFNTLVQEFQTALGRNV